MTLPTMRAGQLHENLKRIFASSKNAKINMTYGEVSDKILQI
jgi:hypothetical protein